MAAITQAFFQAGADEGAVGGLGDNGLARQGRGLRLEVVALLTRAKMRGGFGGIVPDMKNRPAA